jgi:GTP-binding protein EngB required for normal cell division
MDKMTFRAETVIQAIIAALIFMVVFLISLDTIVRITTSNDDAYLLVDANYQISSFFAELSDGKHQNGSYTKYFPEGKLSAEISQYKHYNDLQMIVIKAEIDKIKKHIIFRHIAEIKNE